MPQKLFSAPVSNEFPFDSEDCGGGKKAAMIGMIHTKAMVEAFLQSDNHTSTHRHSPEGPIQIDPDSGFLNWLTPVFPAGGIVFNLPIPGRNSEGFGWFGTANNHGNKGGY